MRKADTVLAADKSGGARRGVNPAAGGGGGGNGSGGTVGRERGGVCVLSPCAE